MTTPLFLSKYQTATAAQESYAIFGSEDASPTIIRLAKTSFKLSGNTINLATRGCKPTDSVLEKLSEGFGVIFRQR